MLLLRNAGQLKLIMRAGLVPDAMKPGFQGHQNALEPGFHGVHQLRRMRIVMLMVPECSRGRQGKQSLPPAV
jgi:hypothetical protein